MLRKLAIVFCCLIVIWTEAAHGDEPRMFISLLVPQPSTFSPDGRMALLVDGRRKQITVIDSFSLETVNVVKDVVGGAFSNNGRFVVSTKNDKQGLLNCTLTSVEGKDRPFFFSDSNLPVACSPDGKTVVTADGDTILRKGLIQLKPPGTERLLKVWNIAERKLSRTLMKGSKAKPILICFSPNGKLLAIGLDDSKVKLLDSDSGRELGELAWDSALPILAFSSDGKTLAASTRNGAVVLRDADSRKDRCTLKHDNAINSLMFSLDNETVVTASQDSVRLWTVNDGKEKAEFKNQRGPLALSADGKLLATVSTDRLTVKLIDMTTNKVTASRTETPIATVNTLFVRDGEIRGLAFFSLDGKKLARSLHQIEFNANIRSEVDVIHTRAVSEYLDPK